jgi:DNA-directed RNA polymerase specialized sigma24 family protein
MGVLEKELSEAVRRCAPALLQHLDWLLDSPDAAQEILQEACVRYLLRRRRGAEIRHPFAYLVRVCSRLALKELRKLGRREGLTHRQLRPSPGATEGTVLAWEALERVWPRLDPLGRLVARALLVEGIPARNVAAFTGLPRFRVNRRVRRIVGLLKRVVGAADEKNGEK